MKTKYRVGMLATGTVYKEIIADSEEEAKEIACEEYGDMGIELCSHCADKINGLTISENTDFYDTEEIGTIV